jgi:hypothetical protein
VGVPQVYLPWRCETPGQHIDTHIGLHTDAKPAKHRCTGVGYALRIVAAASLDPAHDDLYKPFALVDPYKTEPGGGMARIGGRSKPTSLWMRAFGGVAPIAVAPRAGERTSTQRRDDRLALAVAPSFALVIERALSTDTTPAEWGELTELHAARLRLLRLRARRVRVYLDPTMNGAVNEVRLAHLPAPSVPRELRVGGRSTGAARPCRYGLRSAVSPSSQAGRSRATRTSGDDCGTHTHARAHT